MYVVQQGCKIFSEWNWIEIEVFFYDNLSY